MPVNRAQSPAPFHILALSGGGFRGLYTAKIAADLEASLGAPLASRFDLIAGTSIGGILALALALEIPASRIVELFVKHGGEIFEKRWSLFGFIRAPYSPANLNRLLRDEDVFGDRLLGACRHPVLVPAINYTTGQAVMFKTAHHEDLKRDHLMPLADVALATSAAPGYFPRHRFEHNQYVDGGLFANAPGLMALHEAENFFHRASDGIHILSIGSMSARFTVDTRRAAKGGAYDWGGVNPVNMAKRLFGLSISVQEILSCHMLTHRLGGRYVHVDDALADERARAVALDKTDAAAREVLLGVATQRSKTCVSDPKIKPFLDHVAATPHFFYGPYATRLSDAET